MFHDGVLGGFNGFQMGLTSGLRCQELFEGNFCEVGWQAFLPCSSFLESFLI